MISQSFNLVDNTNHDLIYQTHFYNIMYSLKIITVMSVIIVREYEIARARPGNTGMGIIISVYTQLLIKVNVT